MLNTLLPQNTELRRKLRLVSTRFNFSVTPRLRRKFTTPSKEGVDELREYLRTIYIPSWYDGVDLAAFLASSEGAHTIQMHLNQRLQLDRYQFVPWMSSTFRLKESRILEIGCGTGSASISLAEQGAVVTSLDVHTEAVEATKIRARAHGLKIMALTGNAENLRQMFRAGSFEMIVFFAVLEHMTLDERYASLKAAWDLLPDGGYLCLTDTPNRLWPYDSHTSHMPFFHWLPDDLAFAYSKASPRFPFNARFRERNADASLLFIRQGRG